jgi:hypothetical protein
MSMSVNIPLSLNAFPAALKSFFRHVARGVRWAWATATRACSVKGSPALQLVMRPCEDRCARYRHDNDCLEFKRLCFDTLVHTECTSSARPRQPVCIHRDE